VLVFREIDLGVSLIMKRKAIYAGSFDPLTLGHMDLIERSALLFDSLILAVAVDTPKNVLFTIEERIAMAEESVKRLKNVSVKTFDGLLIDYARETGVNVLIRGLRVYSDFEYEFQMALTNRKLAPEIETLFMMPKENHSYVSSSTVKEIARLGGDVSDFVPEAAAAALAKKFSCKSK
jgi:pantetheine-phosphate adenylyltransferase